MQPLALKPEIADIRWISNSMLALAIGGCIWLQFEADAARSSIDQIIGQKYVGHVLEADESAMPGAIYVGELPVSNDAVTTTFGSTKDGQLTGTYTVNQHGDLYTGTLAQHGPIHDHAALFDWRDKYGSGTVSVEFDHDYCQFTGSWNFNGMSSMSNSPWDGHRE